MDRLTIRGQVVFYPFTLVPEVRGQSKGADKFGLHGRGMVGDYFRHKKTGSIAGFFGHLTTYSAFVLPMTGQASPWRLMAGTLKALIEKAAPTKANFLNFLADVKLSSSNLLIMLAGAWLERCNIV